MTGFRFPAFLKHRPEARAFTGADGALPVEITQPEDVRIDVVYSRRAIPLVDGWQTLAGVLRVGGGFEPADAADGEVPFPFGIGAELPRGGARTPGGVTEARHCVGK